MDHFSQWIDDLDEREREQLAGALTLAEARSADGDWPGWAHHGQRPPEGEWRSWVIMAGRGFGKTLAGSQWIRSALLASGEAAEPLRIALVGATLDEARRVMVEGKSGLLAVAGDLVAEWHPTRRLLRFAGGAEATLFSGASPEALRGPEHHLAWCDELAKWEKPKGCWDMLQLGLRLGGHPRALVTTTPRPGPVLRAIMDSPGCAVTRGGMRANPHLAKSWKEAVESLYAGTRLGRQELDGELLSDHPGALWSVELIERCRAPILPGTGRGTGEVGGGAARSVERSGCASVDTLRFAPGPSTAFGGPPPPASWGRNRFTRTLIAVDPPAGDGTCGIVACAKDAHGVAHVLADHSVTGRSPEGWARAVADAARIHGAHPSTGSGPGMVVAEANQGGKMVQAVLRTADPSLKVKLVTATVGKAERAAPVAHLFEAGKVLLHGRFPELEAELLGMIAGGDYEGPGTSPDRADAMVWGLTELMLGVERREPRVMTL